MFIDLKCPSGHRRRVGIEYAGKSVVCDECGHVWRVPAICAPDETRRGPPVATGNAAPMCRDVPTLRRARRGGRPRLPALSVARVAQGIATAMASLGAVGLLMIACLVFGIFSSASRDDRAGESTSAPPQTRPVIAQSPSPDSGGFRFGAPPDTVGFLGARGGGSVSMWSGPGAAAFGHRVVATAHPARATVPCSVLRMAKHDSRTYFLVRLADGTEGWVGRPYVFGDPHMGRTLVHNPATGEE